MISLNDFTYEHITILRQEAKQEFPFKPNTIVVKKGETLYRIASTYGLSIYELKNYNSLSSSNIFVGQKLYLETPIQER